MVLRVTAAVSSSRSGRAEPRGITLIEVLFAIGVVIIGLLGVFILIPVAGVQSGRGSDADRMAAMGRNAEALFHLRGMGHPGNWLWYHRASSQWLRFQPATGLQPYGGWRAVGINTGNAVVGTSANPTPRAVDSFAIDPRSVARNYANASVDGNYFPYVSLSPLLQMPRVALRQSTTSFRPFYPPPTNQQQMILFADELFQGQDDLIFVRDERDPTLEPYQLIFAQGADGAWGNAGVDDNEDGTEDNPAEAGSGDDILLQKRPSEGRMSWMAMLTPKLERFERVNDLYNLYLIVFAGRSLLMDGTTERLASIAIDATTSQPRFESGGYSGGDVVLEAAGEETLQVVRGDWIMLSSILEIADTSLAAGDRLRSVFQWYRVLAAAPEPAFNANTGKYELEVTLIGPDWTRNEWLNSANPLYKPTQVTIVPQVVGIFEKTIRLEDSSIWGYW